MFEPIISPNIRLRNPDLLTIGEGSIIDDFCYISTQMVLGRFVHIASGCNFAGGGKRKFQMGDYGGVASGAKLYCTSDNFVKDISMVLPGEIEEVKENLIFGDIICERLNVIGANAVVMPDNYLPEGAMVGALSFVPTRYEFKAWTIYAGIPIKPIKQRDQEAVLRQLELLEKRLLALREERKDSAES